MVSLASVQTRFEIPFTLLEGGSGQFPGVIGEAPQTAQPSNIFVSPRQILRVPQPSRVSAKMVVRTPAGAKFLLGTNGHSETSSGVLWNSFRMFEVVRKAVWQRRMKGADELTGLPRDIGLQNMGTIWVVLETIDRENLDRKMHNSEEQTRFLAGAEVLADDILDGRKVIRSDIQLGLRVGVIA